MMETKETQIKYLTPALYLKDRVDDQLSWYGKRSAQNKYWYYRLQIASLISAVTVPVVSLSFDDFIARLVVAILGATAAVAAGLLSMYQFRDQWLDYRSTAESIKFEKHLFLTRSMPYAADNAFNLFVQRVESLILSENTNWKVKKLELADNSETQSNVSPDHS